MAGVVLGDTARAAESQSVLASPFNSNGGIESGDDEFPQLASDGAKVWIAVWQSTDGLGGLIGSDRDILFSRSLDGGAAWSRPAPLNTNAGLDLGADSRPRITTDHVGTWVVVWQSTDTLGARIGDDRDILVTRSTDNGVTWSKPSFLNSNAAMDSGEDYQPAVATDGRQTWIVSWVSNDSLDGAIGSDFDILFARSTDRGLTWSQPKPLNPQAATDAAADAVPQLRTDGTGTWVALWTTVDIREPRMSDLDILVARSTDDGLTWTTPGPLSADGR